MRIKEKVAIITGGARGIGQAVGELFAREGARVVLWDVLDEGNSTAENIRNNGGQAEFMKISVTDREAVENGVKSVASKYGRIDVLINNAGITRDKTLLKMSDEEWNAVIQINLSGTFYCTRAVAEIMKNQNYGRIVSAASTVAIRGNFGQTNYVASKAAIIGMTKTWALELGKYGVTANCIAPGYTETPMTDLIPDNIKELSKLHIPLGFLAQPMDIAYGYLYLASDEARFVSGICLPIDGGQSR